MNYASETLTLETRWFGTGSLPKAVEDWFTTLGPIDTSTRTDLYFHPYDISLNVKIRDDYGELLQIKRQLGRTLTRTFGPDVTGRAEQWYKWSFSLDDTPNLWNEDHTGLWIPVEKTRMQQSFDGDEIELLENNVSDTRTTIGIELTEVVAEDETAWTFCLEVNGPSESLEETLDIAGSVLLKGEFPVSLSASQSFGYTHWLRQFLSRDSLVDSAL